MYCEKFNVLTSILNGFRKGKSTITAIYEFICNVVRGFEIKENFFGIYLNSEQIFGLANNTIKSY